MKNAIKFLNEKKMPYLIKIKKNAIRDDNLNLSNGWMQPQKNIYPQ
jgi:hypothetical protein